VVRRLLEKAVFEIVLSVLILLTATTGTVRKLIGVVNWVEGQLPLLSPAQEEVEDEGSSQEKQQSKKSLIESFRAYRENVEDKADSDSNSQHSDSGPERPALSSFPTYPLEKDTLEVPVLRERDSTRTSLEVDTATPLVTDPSTPQGTETTTPQNTTSQLTDNMSNFRFPIPVPGSKGMLYFSDANITEFLERFDELCDEYQVVDRRAKLPRYYDSARREIVKSLPE
jgi:hypothetical protein